MVDVCAPVLGVLVFALLSGFLGWLLRDWQMRGRIQNYKDDIKRRDTQILNTSAQLDKEVKQKDEHINKMVAEINSLEANNGNLSRELVSLKSSALNVSSSKTKNDAVKITHDLVDIEDDDVELVETGEEGQDAVDGFEVNILPLEAQVEDNMLDDIITLKKKLKRRRRRIRRLQTAIQKLSKENTSLRSQLKAAGSTIVEVSNKADQRKLKKILSNLHAKKNKRVVDKNAGKGKAKDVKK